MSSKIKLFGIALLSAVTVSCTMGDDGLADLSNEPVEGTEAQAVQASISEKPTSVGLQASKRIVDLCPATSTITYHPGAEGKDADVFSLPSSTNTNRGAAPQLDALTWTFSGVPGTYRSYIEFDLSNISSGATVTSATLTLFANTTPSTNLAGHSTLSGSNNGLLARVTGPWDEMTITWNNQPSVDLANAIAVPASVSTNQTYNINVTGMVSDMVHNPGSNHGFMLRLATEQFYRALRFWSSDAPDASQHPVLTVVVAGCI